MTATSKAARPNIRVNHFNCTDELIDTQRQAREICLGLHRIGKGADEAGGYRPLETMEILLAERLYGGRFVVFHVEDGIELGDLQQVVNFLGEVEQLEFAALVFHGGVGADQLADA